MTQTLEMPHLPQNKTEKNNKKKLVKSRQASAIGLAFPCSNLQQIFSFLQFLQKQLHAEKKLLQIQVVHPCLVHFFLLYTKKQTIINLCNNIQSFQNLGIYQFKQFPEDQVLLSPPPSKKL